MLVSTPSASQWTTCMSSLCIFLQVSCLQLCSPTSSCAIFKVPYVGKLSLIERLSNQYHVLRYSQITVQIHIRIRVLREFFT